MAHRVLYLLWLTGCYTYYGPPGAILTMAHRVRETIESRAPRRAQLLALARQRPTRHVGLSLHLEQCV